MSPLVELRRLCIKGGKQRTGGTVVTATSARNLNKGAQLEQMQAAANPQFMFRKPRAISSSITTDDACKAAVSLTNGDTEGSAARDASICSRARD